MSPRPTGRWSASQFSTGWAPGKLRNCGLSAASQDGQALGAMRPPVATRGISPDRCFARLLPRIIRSLEPSGPLHAPDASAEPNSASPIRHLRMHVIVFGNPPAKPLPKSFVSCSLWSWYIAIPSEPEIVTRIPGPVSREPAISALGISTLTSFVVGTEFRLLLEGAIRAGHCGMQPVVPRPREGVGDALPDVGLQARERDHCFWNTRPRTQKVPPLLATLPSTANEKPGGIVMRGVNTLVSPAARVASPQVYAR